MHPSGVFALLSFGKWDGRTARSSIGVCDGSTAVSLARYCYDESVFTLRAAGRSVDR